MHNQLPAPATGPVDLALTFTSPFDGSAQPYRLYLPSAHDGTRAVPLLLAMHGTGGDQNKYFDHETYGCGLYKREAEKRGMAVLCPLGNDVLNRPTEWRGTGELHVLAAIEDVCRRFRIDRDRIVCTGQSMGGTGTTYLCCRYPDLFAAGIPLASTYGHVALVANLRHTPMFFVQGEKDWPPYAQTGPIPLTDEIRRQGYAGELWMVPGAEHNTMDISTGRVMDWAVRQARVAHPRHITHRAFFPPHGRAWWVEIQEIERPGWFAEVDARAEEGNRIVVKARNTTRLVLRPDPALYDRSRPLAIRIEDRDAFQGLCNPAQQVCLNLHEGVWTATVEPRRTPAHTDWQDCPIARVTAAPDWSGEAETTLGNWLADGMRDIAQADIAICTKGHFRYGEHDRGAAARTGQTLHLMELIDWLRPCDSALATFRLSGAQLLDIIEDNIRDDLAERRFLVQVSGCRYRFDRRRPHGQRIVWSDIDPGRDYAMVCPSSDIARGDTLHLGELYGRLAYETLESNTLSTAWRYAVNHRGQIAATLDGRIVETSPAIETCKTY